MLSLLDKVQSKLADVGRNTRGFAEATDRVEKSAQSAGKGAEKGSNGLLKFASSLARIAKYRMLRSVLKALTSAFKEGLENVYLYSNGMTGEAHRMAESLDSLATANQTMKNQIGSAWGELLSIIQPVIDSIMQAVQNIADWLSQLFAAFGGNSSYYKAVDASAKWAKNTKTGAKAAKEMRRTLMGFDEINRLDDPTKGTGGGGGAAKKDPSKMFEYTKISDRIKKIAETIKTNMPLIEAAISPFLLGLGAILTFSGANIPLGLGLMAAGAVMLAHSVQANWDAIPPKVQSAFATIMTILGSAMFAIGAVFMLTGHFSIGLGLMIAGIASVGGVAAVWGKLNSEVQHQISELMLIVGAAMVAIGVVFLFAGAPGIGLAMILAGGAMAVTALNLDWDYLKKKLDEKWKAIKEWWRTGPGKIFTADYWKEKWQTILDDGILGVLDSFAEDFKTDIDKFSSWIDGLLAPRHLQVNYGIAQDVATYGGVGIPWFASGGFPEDGLFLANHGELVGQFSNGNTAVANNEQIISGIERGVYNAMTSALAGQNSGSRDIRVYLDGKEIGAASRRYERQMNRATGVALG